MGTNEDFYDKEFNLNCFYMPSNFEQKYPKTAIVIEPENGDKNICSLTKSNRGTNFASPSWSSNAAEKIRAC